MVGEGRIVSLLVVRSNVMMRPPSPTQMILSAEGPQIPQIQRLKFCGWSFSSFSCETASAPPIPKKIGAKFVLATKSFGSTWKPVPSGSCGEPL